MIKKTGCVNSSIRKDVDRDTAKDKKRKTTSQTDKSREVEQKAPHQPSAATTPYVVKIASPKKREEALLRKYKFGVGVAVEWATTLLAEKRSNEWHQTQE